MDTIKTVIFDLGGVYFTDGARRFVQTMKEVYGIEETKTLAMIGGEIGNDYRTGNITPEEFWRKAKEYWGMNVETEELSKIWLREYVPIKGTQELIHKLDKAGYEILFLSDNASDRIAYLEKTYGFLSDFRAGVFSHIVKARKPDPKMYKAVVELASNPANECLYIDDKPALLEPASQLGMSTIAFSSPEQVEADLRKAGVHF